MSTARATLALAAVASLAAAGTAAAQAPEIPTPGPEHELFEKDAGTWDATVEVFVPGGEPMVSKGVEVNTIGCGGLCLISDFKGELAPGQSFHGHGTTAWDPAKEKYVGTWTDSMSAGITLSEMTYDEAARTVTGWMEGPDMTGKVVRTKGVVRYEDPDTRVFTMYQEGSDGKEVVGMKISYTRRE